MYCTPCNISLHTMEDICSHMQSAEHVTNAFNDLHARTPDEDMPSVLLEGPFSKDLQPLLDTKLKTLEKTMTLEKPSMPPTIHEDSSNDDEVLQNVFQQLNEETPEKPEPRPPVFSDFSIEDYQLLVQTVEDETPKLTGRRIFKLSKYMEVFVLVTYND